MSVSNPNYDIINQSSINSSGTYALYGQVATADGAGGIIWDYPNEIVVSSSLISSNGLGHSVDENVNGTVLQSSPLVSQEISGTTYQVGAFWDNSRYLTFYKREITSSIWTIYTTSIQMDATYDAHEVISLGIDQSGYIHVCYDMHADNLHYRRSTNPIATFDGTLTTTLAMLGTHETSVTYPVFFNDPTGKLYVLLRDGVSQNGDEYFYQYAEGTTTWSAAAGTSTAGLLFNGKGLSPTENAYLYKPVFDDNFGNGGYLHFVWSWRKSGETHDHDMGYMRWNGVGFINISGSTQTIPVTPSNQTTALSISDGSGLLSIGGHLDIDSGGHPHYTYSRLDGSYAHHHHIWHNGSAWIDYQLTNTDQLSYIIPRTDFAIDRTSGRAYVIYTDTLDANGLNVLVSNPDDYLTWTKENIYNHDVGWYMPNYDVLQWRNNHIFYFPVAYYLVVAGAQDVVMVRWDIGNFYGSGITVGDTATVNLTLNNNVLSADVIPGGIALSSLGVPTANVSINDYKITNLTDPTSSQDAATKKYVDDKIASIPSPSSGAGSVLGVNRWIADGGTAFVFPDTVEQINWLSDNGVIIDSVVYTLSSDRTGVIFDSGITAGHILLGEYIIAQI